MGFQKSFLKYAFFIGFVSFFTMYFYATLGTDTLNILQPTLEDKFGWSRSAINAPATLGGMLSIISAFVISTLILKYGIKKNIVVCYLVIGAAHVWMANSTTLASYSMAMVVIQVFIIGILTCSWALANNWFLKLRGRFLGIITCGCPIGTATFTPTLTRLIERYGFPTIYTGLGILVIIFGLIFIILIKDEPEEVGFGPDGEDALDVRQNDEGSLKQWTLKELLKLKETWILFFAIGFLYLILTAVISTFLPRFLDVGIPKPIVLTGMTITALFAMPVSYFWGWLDDKIGTPKACTVFSITYILLAFFLLKSSVDNMASVFLAMLFFASMMGGMPNLHPSIIAYVYGRKEFVNANRYLGVVHGLLRSLGFIGMGIAYDIFKTYNPAYYVFMVLAGISAISFFTIKKTYDPERLKIQGKGLTK